MKTRILISLLAILVLSASFGAQLGHAAGEPSDPPMAIYVVPPITDEKILPTTAIPDSYISNEISVVASPGEYEPASFVIHALDNIDSLEVEATELRGESDSIPNSNIDIRVVKCWYQAGVRISDVDNKVLTPELLLKDDSLVKVEDEENYVRLTTGEYVWASQKRRDEHVEIIPIEEFLIRDSPTLQPVNIPKGTNKQFWVTVKVPRGSIPGTYTGKIELRTSAGSQRELQLNLEVPPINLSQPYLIYSIYWGASLGRLGSISYRLKNEEQWRAEFINLREHGIANPAIWEPFYKRLEQVLAIRNEIGIGNQPLYYLGLEPWGRQSISRVREITAIAQSYGIPEVYFYGTDEAKGEALIAQRPHWEAIREAGGKIFASCSNYGGNAFDLVGDILDLAIFYGPPSAEEAAKWHSVGHQIFCYSNPQVGEEKPETYRRNFGLLLWQNDYDGAMDFAYQWGFGNIWNDFDHSSYRDHNFTYPTMDGVIDTIQWEGWREGVDDIRYLTTLLEIIEEAKADGEDTSSTESWLADLKTSDLTKKNLDSVRSEMIGYILSLHNWPPVLAPVGDKSVDEGQLLQFTISATDPDDDSLTYSASNLPEGASFDPETQTFSWTPRYNQAGVYPDVHFEVSDGKVTDSEDITITVLNSANWAIIGATLAFIVVIISVILLRRRSLHRRSGQR